MEYRFTSYDKSSPRLKGDVLRQALLNAHRMKREKARERLRHGQPLPVKPFSKNNTRRSPHSVPLDVQHDKAKLVSHSPVSDLIKSTSVASGQFSGLFSWYSNLDSRADEASPSSSRIGIGRRVQCTAWSDTFPGLEDTEPQHNTDSTTIMDETEWHDIESTTRQEQTSWKPVAGHSLSESDPSWYSPLNRNPVFSVDQWLDLDISSLTGQRACSIAPCLSPHTTQAPSYPAQAIYADYRQQFRFLQRATQMQAASRLSGCGMCDGL
jgi:hypothetical protein